MKNKLSIVTLGVGLLCTTALAAKTFKYVCHNEGCRAYKQVVTFEENIRYEHKCAVCGKRLSPAD